MRTGCLVAIAVSGLFGSVGCSGNQSQRAEVSGTVALDGNLIEEGSINFFPTDGTDGPTAGAAIIHGKYHIERSKGVAVGKNRVELHASKGTGRKVPNIMAPGSLMDERVNVFSPRYSGEKSVLIREVEPRSNTIDFDLMSNPDNP